MNGEVHLTVTTSMFKFILTFNRNVSIIRGDSGTGKSLAYELVQAGIHRIPGTELEVVPNVPVRVIGKFTVDSPVIPSWVEIIKAAHNTVFVIDEEADCLKGNPVNFSSVIRHTDNYYVIITRKKLADIPYSVQSVYELEVKGNTVHNQVIIENKVICGNVEKMTPSRVITEDSGSGLKFFIEATHIASTANGKTRIHKEVKRAIATHTPTLFVVDGAAFGPELCEVLQKMKNTDVPLALYMPESFEWLALNSIEFDTDAGIQLILIDYLDMIDYTKYFSVEQYMTDVFKRACSERGYTYDKSAGSLPDFVLTPENTDRLISMVPGVTFTNKK